MSNAERKLIGSLPNGQAVESVTLNENGLSLEVLSLGATMRDLRMVGYDRPLILGMQRLDDYQQNHYMGAVNGRVGNRIAKGRVTIDDRTYQLDQNEGQNMLHGGTVGFSKRVWTVDGLERDYVSLVLTSDDGDQNFPGKLEVRCTYRLRAPRELVIELTARSDTKTLCNLVTHPYFNFDGHETIDRHVLKVHADRYTYVDEENIPTGAIESVHGTELDCREYRSLKGMVLDHNFVLGDKPKRYPTIAAELLSEKVKMTVLTTEPGLQCYTGDNLICSGPNLHGQDYRPRAGVCLEPQLWPDAPNHAGFPSMLLAAQDRYRQRSIFRFELRGDQPLRVR